MRSRVRSNGSMARRGSTLPIVVLALVALVALAAFAVDISRMYMVHAQLQTAAEAGALAGTDRLLHDDGAAATDSAMGYGRSNPAERVGADVATDDVVFGHWEEAFTPTAGWSDPNTNAVQVTARHTANYTFGVIYGTTQRALAASATSVIGSVGKTSCIRPLAIPYASLLEVLYPTGTPPVTYDLTAADVSRLKELTIANAIQLKTGDASDSPVPGNYYAVREGPVQYADGRRGDPWTGGNNFRDGLSASCNDLTEQIGVGDWLEAENGNMVGPTKQGLADACGVGAATSFVCPVPAQFLIPIWDIADKGVASPNAFRVKYLGVFYATGYSNNIGITGYFSALAASGSYDPHPGPLMKAALRR